MQLFVKAGTLAFGLGPQIDLTITLPFNFLWINVHVEETMWLKASSQAQCDKHL